jgi:hypothetical protein
VVVDTIVAMSRALRCEVFKLSARVRTVVLAGALGACDGGSPTHDAASEPRDEGPAPTTGSPAASGPGSPEAPEAPTSLEPNPEAPEEFAPGPGALKRLTDAEFRNSLRDVLGEVTLGDLEPDSWFDGFAKVGSSVVSISANGVDKYWSAIDGATAQVFADPSRRAALVGCEPSTGEDVCVDAFIARFGRLAWRRPFSEAQLGRYGSLASELSTSLGDVTEALRQTANAILFSPHFLYRVERGSADPSSRWWRFDSHEMASRLAYFLTNTTPDAPLLDAADRDELAAVEGVRAQAERLLGSVRGRESVGNFATELFRLAIVRGRAKDPERFPSYTLTLQEAMAREVPAMFQSVVFDERAAALDLFTTRRTFVNRELAALYGLDATGLGDESWVAVELPPDGLRAGLLGTAAFLSIYANQKEGSPTLRGKFIRELLLCQQIPDPPPDVSTVIEDPPPGVILTKRERLAAHRSQPVCASCHSAMDPLGLPLENFDAIGAFRETEQGRAIDTTGDLDGQAFDGPIALGELLSQSERASACLVRNLYRYAIGRSESATEEPLIDALVERFRTNGLDMQALMIDLVTSDGFRYVGAPEL